MLKNGSAQDYHGYGAVDLYAVDPHLGSVGDYRELVNAAHTQGLKILFDAVMNHVGPTHPWVKNPPMPDWFHGTPAQHLNSASPLNESFYGNSSHKPADHQPADHDPFETLSIRMPQHACPEISPTAGSPMYCPI